MKKITILAAIMVLSFMGSISRAEITVTTAYGSGADAFVGNDTNKLPGNNYGTTTTIDLRISSASLRAHIGYVKFDISGVGGDLTVAQLEFYLTSGGASRTWNVYGLIDNDTDDAWGETTITYNNAPGMLATTSGSYLVDTTKLTLLGTVVVPSTTNVLVTSTTTLLPLDTFLESDTNGLVTLVLIPTGGDRQFYVAAKEGLAANSTWSAPKLIFPNATALNARKPVPYNGNTNVLPSLTQLSWTNPDPNATGGVITCDVYLGTDPNMLKSGYNLTKIATGVTGTSATIPFTLSAPQTYYWVVDCYDTSASPNLRAGVLWNFTTIALPSITADPSDQAQFVDGTAQFTAQFTSLTTLTTGWPKWYKVGTTDQEVNNSLDSRVTISTTNTDNDYTSTLTIANVVAGDEGAYYCEVSNSGGTVTSESANLVIKALRAHWPLNGNANDISGYGLNGTLVGTTAFVTGQIDQALQFNGTDAYVEIPDGFDNFTAGLTFSVWAKPTALFWYDRFVEFGNGQASDNIIFSRDSDTDDIIFRIYSAETLAGTVTATDAISSDEWQLLVVTMDEEGNVIMYKDGLQIQTGTILVPANITRTSNFIGKSNWDDDALYTGLMDDVRVYNYALSADEIAYLYAADAGNFCRTRPDSDYDGDCVVDIGDCIFLAGHWLECGMYPECP